MSISSRLPPPSPGPAPRPSRRPARRPAKPAAAPGVPPPGVPERRRFRRGRLSRLLTEPLPTAALEARVRAAWRPAMRALSVVAPFLCMAALVWALADAWTRRVPQVAPRHRAEAWGFALASAPRFAPPMTVEPSAALVRGRFSPSMPPGMALREVMHFEDRMVIDERTRRVGDYDVATVWL